MAAQISFRQQYQDADPLRVRIEPHRRYSEKVNDLDEECRLVLGIRGREAILDVGCGSGGFLRSLGMAGHSGRIVGLDQSSAMIHESRSAVGGRGPAIEWLIGEADGLPFGSDAFHVVIATHMLYYVEDIPVTLGELGRVAGPNRHVLVTTNSRQ